MQIALAQMSMSPDMDTNLDTSLRYIAQAEDADLLLFPEIQLTPFFPLYHRDELSSHYGHTAEDYLLDAEDWHINRLISAAQQHHLWIPPNVYMLQGDKPYDTSLLISAEGRLVGRNMMVHVMGLPQFWETDYYTPSKEGFRVYDTPWGRVGIVICFDRHLPESIRSCALQGAQLILVPTANLQTEPLEMYEWEMRVQAFQNNVFIAFCNRVGREGDVLFAGQSLVIDPDGQVVARASNQPALLRATIDLNQVQDCRHRRPYITCLPSARRHTLSV